MGRVKGANCDRAWSARTGSSSSPERARASAAASRSTSAATGRKIVVAEWKEHRMQSTVDELDALGVDALGVVCDVAEQESIDAMVAETVDQLRPRRRAGQQCPDLSRPGAGRSDRGGATPTCSIAPARSARCGRCRRSSRTCGRRAGAASSTSAPPPASSVCTATAPTHVEGGHPRRHPHRRARVGPRTASSSTASAPAPPPSAASEGVERAAATGPHPGHRTARIDRLGDPEDDIAPVVLFLCSDACRYLTGQTFMIDGGAFLWA